MADKPLILVVDDEPHVADQIVKMISKPQKYEAVAANSGKAGLDILKKNKSLFKPNRVKLIFLDIKMPEMDGLQFLDEMRKSYSDEQIGVIMLTGYEDEEKWERTTAGYVAGYIKKPIIEKTIFEAIERFFSAPEARNKMTLETFEKHIEKRKQFKEEKEKKG